jgi:Zn-dependent peptidase ImmA (M78 family)
MHSEYAKSGEYKVLPRRNSYVGVKPPEEREADAFAANLLVPESMLKAYKGVASVSELATLFAVSEQVIVNRLNHIERCKA